MIKATVEKGSSKMELEGTASQLCAEFTIMTEGFIYSLMAHGEYKNADDMKSDAAQIATKFALAVKNGYIKAKEEVFEE